MENKGKKEGKKHQENKNKKNAQQLSTN